jgi:hypothetical protein
MGAAALGSDEPVRVGYIETWVPYLLARKSVRPVFDYRAPATSSAAFQVNSTKRYSSDSCIRSTSLCAP